MLFVFFFLLFRFSDAIDAALYGNSNTDALLSAIQAAQERGDQSGEVTSPPEEGMEEVDDESFVLAQILNGSRKNFVNELDQLSQLNGCKFKQMVFLFSKATFFLLTVSH